MHELNQRAVKLEHDLEAAATVIKLDERLAELTKLSQMSAEPDFWSKQDSAKDVMQRVSVLEGQLEPWIQMKSELADLIELTKLGDAKLVDDINKQLDRVEARLAQLKADLKFKGPFDDHSAILSIYAGAGGTDAQDWTQMLFRMYVRWAEASKYKTITITESSADEAGLKSVTFEISGDFIYGKLKSEHGVHRLVRLSPFNANHLRETSFAKVEVLPKISRPDELVIDDRDLKIDVFRSGGHGGQSVNTTDSAVRVTHLPTNVVVVIQNERSQLQNKETALAILRSKLAQLELEQHTSDLGKIKGPNQSAEWGNQIRSYVLHPYKLVKDLRTNYESSDVEAVLEGKLDPLINAYLDQNF